MRPSAQPIESGDDSACDHRLHDVCHQLTVGLAYAALLKFEMRNNLPGDAASVAADCTTAPGRRGGKRITPEVRVSLKNIR